MPEYTGCGGQYPGDINAAYEQEVVELVNSERTSRGLPPLKRVTPLDQSSRYYAADMYQDDYFPEDHGTYDRQGGNLVFKCSWSTRISTYYSNWYSLGENIAVGYSSPQNVMNGWMNSSGHRGNILNADFTEIGVGYYTGSLWVQDFGRRFGIYPLVVNNEAAETDDRNVELYIYGDTTTWTDMRLRNNDLSWSVWMPFQNHLPWQLPDAAGIHTVSVELRKGGTTSTSSDSIYLSMATNPELGNLPYALAFTYNITEQQFTPASLTLTPLNVGDGATLTWQTSQSDDWFEVSPLEGDTPQMLTITPDGSFTITGVYTDSLTVTVMYPEGTLASPWMITVSLTVFEEFQKVYLPAMVNGP